MFPETTQLLEAISKRASRRSFLDEPLSAEVYEKLNTFRSAINQIYPSVRVEIATITSDLPVFTGIFSAFGRANSPLFAAFIGDTFDPHVDVKVGFVAEAFVLFATSLGLGTCWNSGMHRKDLVPRYFTLSSSETVFSVSPLGVARTTKAFSEKLISGLAGSKKRKQLHELLVEPLPENHPEWIQTALENLRIAPSAINRQSWRIRVESSLKTIYFYFSGEETPAFPKALDTGIGICHFVVSIPNDLNYHLEFKTESVGNLHLVAVITFD
ncbi:hypothetical protein RCL1_002330 [Eukaryota sp. TZLM3-RCL]